MPQAETNALANLRLETSFDRTGRLGWRSSENESGGVTVDLGDGIEGDQTNTSEYNTPRYGTDEESSVINDLHSATPPISVPRHDDRPADDLDFPHKPEDVQASPLENFSQNRLTSISLVPDGIPGSEQQQALGEPLAKGDARTRTQRFQPRSSGLRNALSQEDDELTDSTPKPWGANIRRDQRIFPSAKTPTSPDDAIPPETGRPTSLTSMSTASPVGDELKTPPEATRGLFSPVFIPSPTQTFASLDSWPGSKPRGSTNRSSRRSTASSGKSPASMFLSMWSGSEGREEPASKPDDEGQMVGTEYVLGKQIGYGGFSTVKEAYKVEEHGETRRLAVKIVKKQISGKNEKENDEVQAEFDHEVRVWRYLNHPNILTLDAVYETDYATFCFTRYAIGGTLFDHIRNTRRPVETSLAKKFIYQLACALRYLHEDARVVHRDIKLENCLLDPVELPDGTETSNLVLCDFGMAEWMTTDNGPDSPDPYDDAADRPPPKTIGPAGSSTSIAGSLEYASPELLQSTNGVIEPIVDIWAFGVVVFTVVTGKRPFQDPFSPRVKANIVAGRWDQEVILGEDMNRVDAHVREDREHALELIRGCLDLDVDRRWDIQEVLSCRWLSPFAECVEENSPVFWRL